ARLAGIALIHADHREPAGEIDHGIHPRRRRGGIARARAPELELRAQAPGREEQQRVTRSVDFVVDLGIRTCEDWNRFPPVTLRSRLTAVLVVGALGAVVAAGALAQSGKSSLIGKLEGPEVVTDPAKFPRSLKEAPQLAALVKAGKLPPVAERVGQDPLVIKPLHELGKYGGAWRGGFTGPAGFWNGYRCCSGPDHLLFWDYTGDKVTPNIARGYEM